MDVEYNVWYRERADSEWRTMKLLSRGSTHATLLALRPATEYELRVLSQDHIGDGLFSKPIFVRTLGRHLHNIYNIRRQPVPFKLFYLFKNGYFNFNHTRF